MTTTDLILKESRKFGLDDKAITRLAPYSGLRLFSWALKRIVRTNDKDATITSQLETVRLLLTEKVPSHVIKYAYYRLPEAKILKSSEEAIHVCRRTSGPGILGLGIPVYGEGVHTSRRRVPVAAR